MGAYTFDTVAWGTSAQQAFQAARDNALWEHGHGGYTGTIAEKSGFVIARGKPADMSVRDYVDRLMGMDYGADEKLHVMAWEAGGAVDKGLATSLEADDHRIYEDKWGPALCLPTGKTDPERGQQFLFCGYASS